LIRIEKAQGGIGLMGLEAPDFEKIGEDLLTESILPEDLSDVIEKLESPADGADGSCDKFGRGREFYQPRSANQLLSSGMEWPDSRGRQTCECRTKD